MKKQRTFNDLWHDYLEKSFNITIPILAIIAAFLVSGIIILVWGSNLIEAYAGLVSGAFGSPSAIAASIIRGTPLLFTGLAVAYGYRGGFFNIGAEGQLYMGAYAAVWVTTTLVDLHGILLLPIAVIASMIIGALYALIPGILKATRGINEVLTTLLLNYIAIQFTEWVMRVDHYSRDITVFDDGSPAVWTWINWIGVKDAAQPFPKSMFSVPQGYMPSLRQVMQPLSGIFGHTEWFQQILVMPAYERITIAVIFAIIMVIVMYFISFRTTIGYQSRAVGVNPRAARSMGIDIKKTIIITALISGALAGLAGGMEVLGNQHRIIPRFLVNAGFDGIPVALIGQLHPFGVLLSAAFFGALRAGANKMQIVSHVPVVVIYVIQALAILFAIAGTTFDVEATLKKRRLMREREVTDAELNNIRKEVSDA